MRTGVGRQTLSLIFCLLLASSAAAATRDYALKPQVVAPDTYVFVGLDEDFSLRNGGNIVNTGFIVTNDGVVVIDTGPSRLYGEQMRQAIATVTDRPIVRVYNTHLHPDHFLGNQSFADVPIGALAGTLEELRELADTFTNNMYRLVDAWMKGTEAVLPSETVAPGKLDIGGHELEVIALSGHSGADLVLFDHTTGVLFAGDLVFHDRAPTTPHASIDEWITALESLRRIPFKVLVPGHGAVVENDQAIEQTAAYLTWVTQSLTQAAAQGHDMAEVMYSPIPKRFDAMAVLPAEFHRSVTHLFPEFERRQLPLATPRQ